MQETGKLPKVTSDRCTCRTVSTGLDGGRQVMLVAKNDDPGANSLTRGVRVTRGDRYRSLANIRRVRGECQCDGFRSDGAVENLGLIREPTESELARVDDSDGRHFEETTHVWSPKKYNSPLSESLRA